MFNRKKFDHQVQIVIVVRKNGGDIQMAAAQSGLTEEKVRELYEALKSK